MPETYWLAAAALLHLVLAIAAVVAVCRVDAYTPPQRALQTALALLVPVLGAIAVLVAAKEAMAEPPEPDVSRFDRDPYNCG